MTSNFDSSDSEAEVYEFTCRKCPDKTITFVERKSHLDFHLKSFKKYKPGPKSKTQGRKRRPTSPPPTLESLFVPIPGTPSWMKGKRSAGKGVSEAKKSKVGEDEVVKPTGGEPEPQPGTSKGAKEDSKEQTVPATTEPGEQPQQAYRTANFNYFNLQSVIRNALYVRLDKIEDNLWCKEDS